jgi:hypothetical protein
VTVARARGSRLPCATATSTGARPAGDAGSARAYARAECADAGYADAECADAGAGEAGAGCADARYVEAGYVMVTIVRARRCAAVAGR